MAGRKIYQSGLRYKIAQLCLRLLYGRKWHYISPWKHGSAAASVVLTYEGKVLYARRRGNIEHPEKLSLFGGHLDFELPETMEECAHREVKEEAGIDIDISRINLDSLLTLNRIVGEDMLDAEDVSKIVCFYHYELSKEELDNVQDSDESYGHQLYTEEEIDSLFEQGELAFNDHYETTKLTFKKLKSS